MASLLPKTSLEFADPKYWQNFFKNRGSSPFEWYGDFNSLGDFLSKYLRVSDSILQIGCGNSLLADQLYDCGYRNVTNIDSVNDVIDKQKQRNFILRPELKFMCADATKTDFDRNSFTAILDKGTLDALLPPDYDSDTEKIICSLFNEMDRVLGNGGRYITVTLAQQHIVKMWAQHLAASGYMLRVHQCKASSNSNRFMMPVFLLIATKLKTALNMPQVLEFNPPAGKAVRMPTIDDLLSQVTAAQEYSWFCNRCSQGKLTSRADITLHDRSGQPRFEISIVDDPKSQIISSYAVMVVPQGREFEWLFSTVKGQQNLRFRTSVHRLAIVRLCRCQNYIDLESVKDELNSTVMDFAPEKLSYKKVPYLSVAEDVGSRDIIEKGHSNINGDYIVEQVDINGDKYIRLVFMDSQNLVQSEATLSAMEGQTKPSVNLSVLTCAHHRSMLISLGLIDKQNPNLCILGLGGGLLATYLNNKLPQASISGVELDPMVVDIARRCFSYQPNHKSKFFIEDGVNFLVKAAQKGDKFDIIFVDVAGSMHQDGLSCPLPAFVTPETLNNMKALVSPKGCVALNLVTRDEDKSLSVKRQLSDVFPCIIRLSSENDINEVLLCLPYPVTDVKNLFGGLKNKCNDTLSQLFGNELSDKLSNLRILKE